MTNVNQSVEGTKVEVGTIVTITAQGKHFLTIGTDAKIESLSGDGGYNVNGYSKHTDGKLYQVIRDTDFVVKEQPWREVGQAIPEEKTKVGDIMGEGTVVNVTKVDEHIGAGTIVKIVANSGHHLIPGSTATVIRLEEDGDYYVKGDSSLGELEQWLERSDFEVVAEGQPKVDELIGAKAVVVANSGHFFSIGTEVTVIEERVPGYYWSVDGTGHRQSLKTSDFEVIAATKTKGVSDTVMSTTETKTAGQAIKAGDTVTIIGNEPCQMSKLLHNMDRGLHGVPIGTTVTVISVGDDRVSVDVSDVELEDEYYNTDSQSIPLEYVELGTAEDDDDFWADMFDFDDEEEEESEELERLTEDTLKDLRKGDKLVCIGHEDGSIGSDLTLGNTYEVTDGYAKDDDSFTAMLFGGIAKFIDDANDACMLNAINCAAFAKAEATATVESVEEEEFPRLNAETVQELREGDVIIFVGHPEGEYVEGATEGFKYVLTSDYGDKGDFYSSVVGPHADFLDDDGDESFISKRNCVMFAKFE